MSAELDMPLPTMEYHQYQYYGGAPFYGPGALNQMSQAAMLLAQQAKLAAEQFALNASIQAKAAAAKLASNTAASAGTRALTAIPGPVGKYILWKNSAKFENPSGGDIDLYHNRLCFDAPCKHDPNSSNDLEMEWLRRAAPMREYPYVPPRTPIQLLIPKPDREYNLISPDGRAVVMGTSNGMPVELKQAACTLIFPARKDWHDFF